MYELLILQQYKYCALVVRQRDSGGFCRHLIMVLSSKEISGAVSHVFEGSLEYTRL